MPNLYLTSLHSGAGKTALAAATIARLRAQGKRARYYKPVSGAVPDDDAAFCQQAFGDGGMTAMPPPQTPGAAGQLNAPTRKALQSLNSDGAAMGATTCIEGLDVDDQTAAASVELARLAGARVIGVIRYQRGMDLGPVLGLKRIFGVALQGVVLNAVAATSMRVAAEETKPALEAGGVRVLGIVPEDRLLLGFTVSEYCSRLGGRIINNEENAGRIVESLLVGANALDQGEFYYGTVANKALITRGDRPDLQFSALNTSTRCLILTNGVGPIPYVLDHAIEQEVPVMVVPKGTLGTIDEIEAFVTRASFHHPDKLARALEMFNTFLGKAVAGT